MRLNIILKKWTNSGASVTFTQGVTSEPDLNQGSTLTVVLDSETPNLTLVLRDPIDPDSLCMSVWRTTDRSGIAGK